LDELDEDERDNESNKHFDLLARKTICTNLDAIGCHLDAQEQWKIAQKFHPNAQLKLSDNSSQRQGKVARVIYPWNTYEPDRTSKETVDILNHHMTAASHGNFCVKVTALPDLSTQGEEVYQLGVYATKPLKAHEAVFHERSILTVNNRMRDTLCDCCNKILPDIQDCHPCPDCEEATFCSESCLEDATNQYHPALCGQEMDWLFKSTHGDISVQDSLKTSTISNSSNALYALLLLKTLAMSLTQDVHALELLPIKYLYGSSAPPTDGTPPPTLPFTFQDNIVSVFHLLTRLDVDVFVVSLEKFDIWHTLTIQSKILGTASARHDEMSGEPEVAALHLCYSLVNHSCEPLMEWECKSDMIFTTLKDVKEGEEVRDSYTDIRLDWKERREWLMGSLGGACRCERCLREMTADGMDGSSDAKDLVSC